MKRLAFALALTGAFALSVPTAPAVASMETVEARITARSAAELAHDDMVATFGVESVKNGHFLWNDAPASGEPRVVVSLPRQLAYLYRGNTLVAVSTISSGKSETKTPNGIFSVLSKKRMHRSRKYENAPMPFAQFIDKWGVALHAGHLPGRPASHGCVRLPAKFAAKLFEVTDVGTPVIIGA